MQAINNQLTSVIQGNKQFVIPVFQRDYSWTTEQCEQLWDDVSRAGRSSDGSHFMGSFVYADSNTGAAFSQWLVIDGQQRLTTLTLLLTALRDHIQDVDWNGQEPTLEQIDSYFLKNTLERGDRNYKLALRRHDNDTLRALVDGHDPRTVSNRSDLIIDAYEFFREQLSSLHSEIAEIYQGIGRLHVVDVKLEHHLDNPQLVFESLNSTGVDLTESDLIRNYLLMGLPEAVQTRMYEEYWSKVETLFRDAGSSPDVFLRDYVAFQQKFTTQIRADRVYSEFKKFWQLEDAEPLPNRLENILRSARHYASFLKPDRIENKPIRDAMSLVRRLGIVHATPIMRLYECYDRQTLSQEDFVKALTLIESFLVRRSVLQLQTRGYWSIFARMAHAIDEKQPFTSFQVALARQSYRFPSDQEFATALQERDLYNLRICWHILSQLENSGHAEPSPTNEYSIEHIMPQAISDVHEWQLMLGTEWEDVHSKWVDRLGNLTLTAYNSTYSNRPFHDKKTIEGGFEQSAVRLNEYVRAQTQWTPTEMEERGGILAKRALGIWPEHGADDELVAEDKLRELRSKSVEKNSDDLKMRSKVRALLYQIRDSIRDLGESVEVVERKSVCFYDRRANFMAETLPMSWYVRVLVPMDFDEVYDPEGIADDVTLWKFLPNVVHRDCGVFVDVWESKHIPATVAMIRQAQQMASE